MILNQKSWAMFEASLTNLALAVKLNGGPRAGDIATQLVKSAHVVAQLRKRDAPEAPDSATLLHDTASRATMDDLLKRVKGAP